MRVWKILKKILGGLRPPSRHVLFQEHRFDKQRWNKTEEAILVSYAFVISASATSVQ